MTKLFKALGATLLATVIAVAGFAMPAYAGALVSPSVTATGTIGTSGSNAYPITFTATTITSADTFTITAPSGWSTSVQPGANCSGTTVTGMNISQTGCNVVGGKIVFYGSDGNGGQAPIPANTLVTVTVAAGKYTTASGRDFVLASGDGQGNAIDSSTVTLGTTSSFTVTFDANGGSGSMSTQSSSSAITLTPNAFTRSNYNFAGWNTAADGSGTAYADAASYPFTSSATLYAQWTPTLANTGMSDVTWQLGEITLALMGFGILLYIRQRKRNA